MTEPKTRKTPEPKLPYEVVDIEALEASRPELVSEETVHRVVTIRGQATIDVTNTRKFVSKDAQSLLYQLVKLNHRLGVETPGVTVGEKQESAAERSPNAQELLSDVNQALVEPSGEVA